jgi:hypothetical protein
MDEPSQKAAGNEQTPETPSNSQTPKTAQITTEPHDIKPDLKLKAPDYVSLTASEPRTDDSVG